MRPLKLGHGEPPISLAYRNPQPPDKQPPSIFPLSFLFINICCVKCLWTVASHNAQIPRHSDHPHRDPHSDSCDALALRGAAASAGRQRQRHHQVWDR